MADLHISIVAEPIFSVGGMEITNSMFTSVIVSILLITFAMAVHASFDPETDRPKGLQNFAEWLIESFYNLTQSVTGSSKKTRLFLPIVISFFLFILLNNWLGLFPGVGPITVLYDHETKQSSLSVVEPVHAATQTLTQNQEDVVSIDSFDTDPEVLGTQTEHSEDTAYADTDPHTESDEKGHYGPVKTPIFRPGSADLNTTFALGIFSIVATQVFGIRFNRLGYFKKFFNFSSPILFYVGILELVSEFAKIISFAFRLFGNIFAGEVLLVVIGAIVPVIVPMPFYGLEIFVGFIQAFVFAMLSMVFFNMATESHDH